MQLEQRSGAPEAELLIASPDYAMATWDSIFILIWRHDTTNEGIETLRHKLEHFGRSRPQGLGLVTIVEQEAPMPTSAVREKMAGLMADISKVLKCSAVVFEGTGFRAAAVRGVVTGLMLLARQPYPHKVFASMTDGCSWLGSNLRDKQGWEVDPRKLTRAIDELRLRIAGS
jgi:hypothetical protein